MLFFCYKNPIPMKQITLLTFLILTAVSLSFCTDVAEQNSETINQETPKGSLFIIGGGSRPDSMIDRIIDETEILEDRYAIVLTMSGFNPDTSGYYGKRQFRDRRVTNIRSYDFERRDSFSQAAADSLENASLIYITGGSQSRFMDAITETPEIGESLKQAYQDGAMIAGTSAGAAIMSKIMITGDQRNYPEYTATFYNLEKDNMITAEGLGLIDGVIIDQHFVQRARNNRLLTAVMEYPSHLGIGIDESTAIFVTGSRAEVVGESQVLIYNNKSGSSYTHEGKLGANNIRLDILLPGDTFEL